MQVWCLGSGSRSGLLLSESCCLRAGCSGITPLRPQTVTHGALVISVHGYFITPGNAEGCQTVSEGWILLKGSEGTRRRCSG